MRAADQIFQAVLAGLGLVLVVVIGVAIGASWEREVSPDPLSTPCATEDSLGCFWDADVQGNGQGSSFVVDTDGTVYYEVTP